MVYDKKGRKNDASKDAWGGPLTLGK